MAVVLLVADAVAAEDGHGLDGAHHLGDLLDLSGGDAGDLLGPLGAAVSHGRGQLVEAVAPVVHEVVVIQVVGDNVVQDCHGKRAVGAGAHGHPDIGMRSQSVAHRANVDGLGALLHGVETAVGVALVDAGVLGVVAPVNDELCLAELAGHGLVAGHVARAAERNQVGEHALRVADGGVHVVGRSVNVEETAAQRAKNGIVLRGQDAVGLGAVLLLLLEQLGGDLLDRLLPRDALELALALLARTLHRVLETRGRVHDLHGGVALGAQRAAAAAPVVAGLRVALDVGPAAVLEVAQRGAVRAGGATHLAERVTDLQALVLALHTLIRGGFLCLRKQRGPQTGAGCRHTGERRTGGNEAAPRNVGGAFHTFPPSPINPYVQNKRATEHSSASLGLTIV